MPFFAFLLLFFCFFLTLACAALSLPRSGRGVSVPALAEKGNLALFAGLTLACFLLAAALAACNFSFVYAVFNTDRSLHIFYRLTALWGGQEGALLFWAWCASLFSVLFQRSSGYRSLAPEVKRWYWSIFFIIMGFFCLLLTAWNNPFLAANPVPPDGYGLNPLLQNPGMIFHPPLLFLGYGAFTVPCCLALAALATMTAGNNKKAASQPAVIPWGALTRPYILTAWAFLSAGIILGGWWSYMELGWGGYWAWDPVENSSLVPWLIATACLHTALVEEKRNKLHRVNAFLMALVMISAFFSTYLVRGGIINSVHAFGQSDVGMPLLAFVLLFFAFAVCLAWNARAVGDPLENPLTREGLLVCAAWVFLALSVVTILGTMWPVISRLWSDKPVGLSVAFYNTVCPPLFVLLAAILAVCPWVGWNGRVRHKPQLIFVGGVALAVGGVLIAIGFAKPVALLGSAAAVAVMAGVCMLFSTTPRLVRVFPTLAAHGVHVGFALLALGVAFSGPYKTQEDFVLKPGQRAVFGEYSLQLTAVGGGDSHDHEPGVGSGAHPDHAASPPKYIYSEAVLTVSRNNEKLGELRPQLRRYASHPDNTYSEVDTVFSWGNELYCSMLGVDQTGTVTLQISVNPLVNWIWVGGVLLCLFPFAGLARRKTAPEQDG